MAIFNALDKDGPRKPNYVTGRKNLLINAKRISGGREMIINAFKELIFPLSPDEGVKVDASRGEDEEEDENEEECYIPREFARIPELSNFENEEETPRGMPDLESEKSAAQRRKTKGQGLKILTPEQMLSRLPISLAQLKAGNNSGKLKNEMRQLWHSLYRSKMPNKTVYNHLINAI